MTTNRPTKRAWPEGLPAGTAEWDDTAMAAFIAHQDAQLAAQPALDQPIRWEELSNRQLKDLSMVEPPAPAKRKIRVRR